MGQICAPIMREQKVWVSREPSQCKKMLQQCAERMGYRERVERDKRGERDGERYPSSLKVTGPSSTNNIFPLLKKIYSFSPNLMIKIDQPGLAG